MNKNYFHRLHSQTPTRMWINNVSRKQADLAISEGAVGCTQNPAYVWKMMEDPDEREYVFEKLDRILKEEKSDDEALIKLQRVLVEGIAQKFMPMYEASGGKAGYVSIQGDPFDESTETILKYALFNTKNMPNLMAKIPVISSGFPAICTLIKERVPINATEVMAVRQALDIGRIYSENSAAVSCPAPLYYSVISGIFDEYLQEYVASKGIEVSKDALWQAGIAVAKKAYQMIKEKGYECRFIGGGARGLHHFTEMVGADCVVTINWNGTADVLIEQDPPILQRFHQPTPHSVIDELLEKVDEFRRAYLVNAITEHEYEDYGPVKFFRVAFEKAWKKALEKVKERRGQLK